MILILLALAFAAGIVVGIYLCDRELRAAQEQADQARAQAQVARDALSLALGDDPCKLPPNC